jgi:cytochrome P450
MIIAEILGVPTDRRHEFRRWSLGLLNPAEGDTGLETDEDLPTSEEALGLVQEFFDRELQKRAENPRDDLITTIVQAEQESDLVTRELATINCTLLLLAGNVTTTTYMSNAMWTYLEEDLIDDLQSGAIDLEAANREVLRYRSPVNKIKRIAAEATTLGGVAIPKGAILTAFLNSANRDEAVFGAPEEFRPGREDADAAIPFGQGVHYCLGDTLANLEADIMMGKFLERVDDVELLVDQIEPLRMSTIFGAAELPIRVS